MNELSWTWTVEGFNLKEKGLNNKMIGNIAKYVQCIIKEIFFVTNGGISFVPIAVAVRVHLGYRGYRVNRITECNWSFLQLLMFVTMP